MLWAIQLEKCDRCVAIFFLFTCVSTPAVETPASYLVDTRDSLHGGKVQLTAHLHLVLKVRVHGYMLLLAPVSSCYGAQLSIGPTLSVNRF